MEIPLWSVFLTTLGLVWYYFKWQRKKEAMKGLKELPGPWGIPILGNAHQVGSNLNKKFCEWSKEFGEIYQVKLGSMTFVVVSGPKMVKEIFTQDPLIIGRVPAPEFSIYEEYPGLGMFNAEGELWETHRRFLLRHLRDFGFGKSSMEVMIMEEVDEVITRYKNLAGTPVGQIRETMRLALVNSLWKIVSSQRFDHDDPELMKLTDNTTKAFSDATENSGLLFLMPLIKYIMPEKSGYRKLRSMFADNRKLFESTIQEHKANLDLDNPKDFIDMYLIEAQKAGPGSSFYGEHGERQLAAILFDLFFAGSDSTAIAIAWSIHYMCKFPHCQKKLQNEITLITGNSRKVTVGDKPNMPYTMALIDEILRYSSLSPDGVLHKAMADTQFHGYYIPKNALVQPNLNYMHHCEKYFEDAEGFKPERFLSQDSTKYLKSENLFPFQVGRRQCVGESLARDTIFLYLCNFFQNFTMKFDPTKEEPGFDTEIGFLRAPLPFTVIMQEN